jgi:hypothetical protein
MRQMCVNFHIAYLLGETELYKRFLESFKLTSHFGVIAYMWQAFFLASLHYPPTQKNTQKINDKG